MNYWIETYVHKAFQNLIALIIFFKVFLTRFSLPLPKTISIGLQSIYSLSFSILVLSLITLILSLVNACEFGRIKNNYKI